jgi:glutaredoxin
MTREVVIFTATGCISCGRAKAFLEQRGVPFTERNVSVDACAMEELMALDARRLPVIRVGTEFVSGFDPKQLSGLLGVEGV